MNKLKDIFSKHGGKRTVRLLAGLAVVMALLCVVPSIVSYAKNNSYLDNITSESIKKKEEEVAKAKQEKAEIQNKKHDIEAVKNELEQKKDDLAAYITELDAKMAEMQYTIEDLEDQIMLKEADIAATELELEAARADEDARYQAMMYRMRLMYERDDSSIISSLLGATSLRDLLNRMDYIEAIVSYDKKAWEQLKAARQYVELCEEELTLEKENLDDSLAAIEEEKANMELLLQEKAAQLEEYNQSIAESQEEIDKYNSQINSEDAEIALLEQAILTEKQQIYAQQNLQTLYDGGAFVFPIASYKYVSSKYGYRTHPITGQTNKFHSGVDLAADYGTAIYAAYSGIVASAGYNASMGNYVMINHGGGLYTIYMHASSLCVSEGDAVATGQTIAKVGSTGSSTGNHLHFTVRKDGNYVDPNDYVYFYAR
ncbi:MAG: peptidoglycan DD-metalloendopeptidase family protein [Lachnospiraceae bacterium]|nr:peptidoglycan DD-metalloendopeptidase family protein [Lachnospiraceae bacterium]